MKFSLCLLLILASACSGEDGASNKPSGVDDASSETSKGDDASGETSKGNEASKTPIAIGEATGMRLLFGFGGVGFDGFAFDEMPALNGICVNKYFLQLVLTLNRPEIEVSIKCQGSDRNSTQNSDKIKLSEKHATSLYEAFDHLQLKDTVDCTSTMVASQTFYYMALQKEGRSVHDELVSQVDVCSKFKKKGYTDGYFDKFYHDKDDEVVKAIYTIFKEIHPLSWHESSN